MIRRMFTVASAISLRLSLATVALLARSDWAGDLISTWAASIGQHRQNVEKYDAQNAGSDRVRQPQDRLIEPVAPLVMS
jgi:hypothetical protein